MGEKIAQFLAVRAGIAPALFFILGIAIPAHAPGRAALLLAALLAVRNALERRGLPGGFLALLCAWALGGSALAGVRTAPGALPPLDDGQECVLEGRVAGTQGAQIVLAVDALGTGQAPQLPRLRLRVLLAGATGLLGGERVRVRARVFRSRPASNPGEPDALARDRERGIALHAVMRPGELLILAPPPTWRSLAARLRRRFDALAADAIADPQARALVVTLAVGDRSGLSPEVNERFNASGLAHILSVSGLHIAVVALGLLAILRWLLLRSARFARRFDARRAAGMLALPAIWAYVALTGAEVPAVRSGLMASLLIAARLVRREPEPYSSLAWAAVACLALDPAQLHDISFELSFVAVLGLMTLANPLRALVPLAKPPPGATGARSWPARAAEAIVSGACTSLAASLATAPIVASAFHRESLVAVLANLFALPIASALTAVSALAAALAPLRPVATVLLRIAGPLARLLICVADAFGALPFAQLRVASPSPTTSLLWYALLFSLPLLAARRRARRMALAAGAALLLLGGWRLAAPRFDDTLEVTFLSVGQGDSTFIRFPGGATLLVDGGGQVGSHFDPGARIIAPFLWERGVSRLDAVALSHPHPDHALGLIGLGPLVPAEELWIPSDIAQGGLLAELEQANPGARVRHLSRGDALPAWGGARLEVLGPTSGAHFDKVNDQSLVLKITYREVSVLLPGDAEADAEAALLAHPAELAATIVKAPHHGSATSSTEPFVRATHARAVVFCVGRDNRFHFPADAVQARWAAAGCERFRTDLDGAVTFRTDGHRVEVSRFLAPGWRALAGR